MDRDDFLAIADILRESQLSSHWGSQALQGGAAVHGRIMDKLMDFFEVKFINFERERFYKASLGE